LAGHAAAVIGAANVGADRERAAAERLDLRDGPVRGADVDDRDVGALAREQQRDGTAEAARAAGHERAPALDLAHRARYSHTRAPARPSTALPLRGPDRRPLALRARAHDQALRGRGRAGVRARPAGPAAEAPDAGGARAG